MKYEIWPAGAQRAGQGQRALNRHDQPACWSLFCQGFRRKWTQMCTQGSEKTIDNPIDKGGI